MLERFWLEMPPVTRLIMLLQLVGLGLHSLGYADRYDLYFNFDKIVFEGQVLDSLSRCGDSSPASSSSNA